MAIGSVPRGRGRGARGEGRSGDGLILAAECGRANVKPVVIYEPEASATAEVGCHAHGFAWAWALGVTSMPTQSRGHGTQSLLRPRDLQKTLVPQPLGARLRPG